MANREGRKTVAVELPQELYEQLAWIVGKDPDHEGTPLKRMSDVLRYMLRDSWGNHPAFHLVYTAEKKKAEAAAKRAAKKEATTPA